jgi:5-methylcytosine-specific restriction endonuclease McrA
VRLVHCDRFPYTTIPFSRRNVFARDEYRCQYCGLRPGGRDLTLDHVVPRSRGGRHCWTNVVACCKPCNGRKGPHPLNELPLKLLQAPRVPKRSPVLRRRLRQPKYRTWKMFVRP